MTPGIIFNSEHLIVYGEYDDGKIREDQEFRNEIQPIMDKLGIVTNDVKNTEGTIALSNYVGHPEVKGVRGVDKRKYLFDLVHIFPRDLNFDEAGALISPEIIQEFRGKIINELLQTPDIKERMNKIQTEIDEVSKTAQDPKDLMKLLEKPFEAREALYNELEVIAKEKTKLNTVYKTEFETSNPKDEDIKTLVDISNYLKEEVLEKMINDCLKDEENLPCESETLKAYLTKYGITSRYYGQIITKIEIDENRNRSLCWLKSLLLREILVKSAASVFNSLLKSVPSMYSQAFAAYFLNVFLGHSNQIKALDYFNINIIAGAFKFSKPEVLSKTNSGENSPYNSTSNTTKGKEGNQNLTKGDDKNKKKKKKRNKGPNKTETNADFKHYLIDNLVGSTVTCLIETLEESTIFMKPLEVIFWFLMLIVNLFNLDLGKNC